LCWRWLFWCRQIGNSLFDVEGAKVVPKLLAKAKSKGVQLLLPIDHIATNKLTSNGADIKEVSGDSKTGIPAGYSGVDVGPRTVARNAQVIWNSKTIIFNG
jgi:phosphoglycerate kinase